MSCPELVHDMIFIWNEINSSLRDVVLSHIAAFINQEVRMKQSNWLEEFQKNVSDLIARSPAADIERNVKAFMAQAFSRMDLVTREEFDVQADLLARALKRADELEKQLQALEQRITVMENERS
jgi:hypothetical protein